MGAGLCGLQKKNDKIKKKIKRLHLLQPGEEEAHNPVQYRGGAEGGRRREDSISEMFWEEEMA